jgi:hypothetical protein
MTTIQAMRDYIEGRRLAALFVTAPPAATTPVGFGSSTAPPDNVVDDVLACWWTAGIEAVETVIDMVLGCDLRTAPRAGDLLAVPLTVAGAAAGRLP